MPSFTSTLVPAAEIPSQPHGIRGLGYRPMAVVVRLTACAVLTVTPVLAFGITGGAAAAVHPPPTPNHQPLPLVSRRPAPRSRLHRVPPAPITAPTSAPNASPGAVQGISTGLLGQSTQSILPPVATLPGGGVGILSIDASPVVPLTFSIVLALALAGMAVLVLYKQA